MVVVYISSPPPPSLSSSSLILQSYLMEHLSLTVMYKPSCSWIIGNTGSHTPHTYIIMPYINTYIHTHTYTHIHNYVTYMYTRTHILT